MGFGQAISTCFSKYAVFTGRARRSEFWWWVVFHIIVVFIAEFLDSLLGTRITFNNTTDTVHIWTGGWITGIVILALLLPTLGVTVRRLHDTDHSGWWWWLNVVCCIGPLILIFLFYIQDSGPDNQYGPNPAGEGGAAPPVTT